MKLPLLPIVDSLGELARALASSANAVLQAPPGAGKTTIVPLALLQEPWLDGAKIVMLEPRRLATRAAARRMAHLLGESVGETVGYRVRREIRVGARTRIEVVTEGVLTRMLNSDPTLDGIGLVVFDEFHERSVHADLGLALTLHSQRLVRPDLRILVMSATLDGAPVARMLGDAPIITSEGRVFPVEVRYIPRRPDQRVEHAAAFAVRQALGEAAGDVLVFLPGEGEIRRTADVLQNSPLDDSVDLHLLYGNLPFDAQDRAIAPAPPGRRKVVLSTSIAESSLTLEGIRVVVDGGWARVPRWTARTGMTRLETVRVSRASAEQRAGRAGRVAPGVCYRLWATEEQAGLVPFASPEILDTDLAPLVLELAAAGIGDPLSLVWLDPPPDGGLAQVRELLSWLGALDAGGRITPHGSRMARLAAHPRLAHMLLRAADEGEGATACDVAALLGDRDPLRADGPAHDADLRVRVDLLRALRRRERLPDRVEGMHVMRDVLHRAIDEAAAWRRELRIGEEGTSADSDPVALGRVLALAYPDRVAQRRSGSVGRYLLRNGTGAVLHDSPALATSPYLVVAETDGRRPESRIYLAASLELEAIERDFGDQIERVDGFAWVEQSSTLRATREERLGALRLKVADLHSVDEDRMRRELIDVVRRLGLGVLAWDDRATRLRERLAFTHAHDSSWPDVSDAALVATLDEWLAPHVGATRGAISAARIDVGNALLSLLSPQRSARLDALAPTHFVAPTGSRVAIDYGEPSAPSIAVRLQEMFGCTETPRLLDGRVPVTIQLLSPARRPVQVTRDLASFWSTSYFDVRKDLRGRYPKHHWPDDPLRAEPTRRVKRRGE